MRTGREGVDFDMPAVAGPGGGTKRVYVGMEDGGEVVRRSR